MRGCISIVVTLCCAVAASAAEPAKPQTTWLTRLVQLAPDGFPLRFPGEPVAAPAVPTPAPAAVEELPLPESPPALKFPAPSVAPPPERVPVVPVRYMTHREFAAMFRPAPGNYEVMMVHPYTHRPVKVCFTLPPGRIKEVDADRNELRFDYGNWELEVHFKRDGRVALDIDD